MAEKTAEQIKKEHEEAARKVEAGKAEARKQDASNTDHKHKSGATVSGAMSTYSTKSSAPAEDTRGPDRGFSFDEIKGFVGEVERGELAHIELDENGTPTGIAFRGIPKTDQVTAPVYGTPAVQFDELVTPSGAPITKFMNPEPTLWDAGMLARNPIPEPTERDEKYPTRGGVVNQPVSV